MLTLSKYKPNLNEQPQKSQTQTGWLRIIEIINCRHHASSSPFPLLSIFNPIQEKTHTHDVKIAYWLVLILIIQINNILL